MLTSLWKTTLWWRDRSISGVPEHFQLFRMPSFSVATDILSLYPEESSFKGCWISSWVLSEQLRKSCREAEWPSYHRRYLCLYIYPQTHTHGLSSFSLQLVLFLSPVATYRKMHFAITENIYYVLNITKHIFINELDEWEGNNWSNPVCQLFVVESNGWPLRKQSWVAVAVPQQCFSAKPRSHMEWEECPAMLLESGWVSAAKIFSRGTEVLEADQEEGISTKLKWEGCRSGWSLMVPSGR